MFQWFFSCFFRAYFGLSKDFLGCSSFFRVYVRFLEIFWDVPVFSFSRASLDFTWLLLGCSNRLSFFLGFHRCFV